MKVRIPAGYRKLTGNQSVLFGEGSTLWELVENLNRRYPGFRERIFDDSGSLRKSVNVYINRVDIRYLKDRENHLQEDDEIYLVPAASGG